MPSVKACTVGYRRTGAYKRATTRNEPDWAVEARCLTRLCLLRPPHRPHRPYGHGLYTRDSKPPTPRLANEHDKEPWDHTHSHSKRTGLSTKGQHKATPL